MITKKTGSMVRGTRGEGAAGRMLPARKCRCGQDLDVCSGTHCPRCGSTLRQN